MLRGCFQACVRANKDDVTCTEPANQDGGAAVKASRDDVTGSIYQCSDVIRRHAPNNACVTNPVVTVECKQDDKQTVSHKRCDCSAGVATKSAVDVKRVWVAPSCVAVDNTSCSAERIPNTHRSSFSSAERIPNTHHGTDIDLCTLRTVGDGESCDSDAESYDGTRQSCTDDNRMVTVECSLDIADTAR